MSQEPNDENAKHSNRLLQTDAPNGIEYGYFAMGFFDLLGQKQAILRIDPLVSSDPEEILNAIKASFGKVIRFRKHFDEFYQTFTGRDRFADAPFEPSEEQLAELRGLEEKAPILQGFSDTVIASAALKTQADLVYIGPSYTLAFAAATTMILSLAGGIVPRGGLDIGFGVDFNDEVYGPVLLSCHELEATIASWPRIVLGRGFVDFVEACRISGGETLVDRANANLAELLQGFMFVDVDGHRAVDYLAIVLFLRDEVPDVDKLIDSAQLTLEQELLESNGKLNIPNKYVRALQYFGPRVGHLTEERRNNALAFRREMGMGTE